MTSLSLATYVVFMALAATEDSAADATINPDWNARQLYEAGCAACHGLDGRGVGQELVGFEEPLPSFSDCSFSSREPDADWFAVVHDGGPVRGFARMMPAFGDILSEAQISATLVHARGFCPEPGWPSGNLNFPRALFTEKAFVEDEVVFTSRISAEKEGRITSKLIYEQRFGARSQVELIVPYATKERSSDWAGGLGDVALGFKHIVYADNDSGTIVSFASEVILPTGDDERGFGSGEFKFEPFVSMGQALPADAFVHAQMGLETPIRTDDLEFEGFCRAVVGQSFESSRFGRAWTPMFEVLAARDLEAGAMTHWDVVPQLQVTLNTRQHLMMGLGARVPVNDREDRPIEGVWYLLWDWFDGGVDEGW